MKNLIRFLFVASIPLIAPNQLLTQWVHTSDVGSGYVYALAAADVKLFAGTRNLGGGAFLSTNSGTNWTPVNTGLTNTNFWSLAVSGTDLFAGTDGGAFRSTNSGTSWTPINTGLTNSYVYALSVSGTNLYAGTYGGVFLSTNNGTSWIEVDSTLRNTHIFALCVSGTNLFAGTFGDVLLSTNNGSSWTALNTGWTNNVVRSLVISGSNVFAGTDGGVFLSTNNGTSWTPTNSGLTNTDVWSLVVSGSNLYAGTYYVNGGVFLSTNDGTTWTEVNTGLTDRYVLSLIISGTNLVAGTYGGGVWRRSLSEMTTSAHTEDGSTSLPRQYSLSQNYPNPFNPTTTISFDLPSESFVSLKVFDALGGAVSTLAFEKLSAGTYVRQWDAQGLASGVYFYRMQVGSFVQTRKLLLLR